MIELNEQPFVCVLWGGSNLPPIRTEPTGFPLSSQLHRRCSYCFKTAEKTNCSKCRITHYCNSNCQAADWPVHRHECKPLTRAILLGRKGAAEAVDARLLGRLVIKRFLLDDRKDISVRETWCGVRNYTTADLKPRAHPLQNYREGGDDEDKGYAVFWRATRAWFRDVFQYTEVSKIDDCDLEKLFDQIRLYAISVMDYHPDYGAVEIGKGIYPNATRFQHSCDPDLVGIFDGTMLRFLPVRPIPATKEIDSLTIDWTRLKGTEVLYSNHALVPREERIEFLKWYCYLKCECHVCTDDDSEIALKGLSNIPCPECGDEDEGTLLILQNERFLKCYMCDERVQDEQRADELSAKLKSWKKLVELELHSILDEEIVNRHVANEAEAAKVLHPSQNLVLLYLREDLFQMFYYKANDEDILSSGDADHSNHQQERVKYAQTALKYATSLLPAYDANLTQTYSDWMAWFYVRMAKLYAITGSQARTAAMLKNAKSAWTARFGSDFKCVREIDRRIQATESGGSQEE